MGKVNFDVCGMCLGVAGLRSWVQELKAAGVEVESMKYLLL